MKYYRYMGFESAKRALKSGEFIVQMPSKFDDPFECRGVMDCVSWLPNVLDQSYRIFCLCNAQGHNDMLFWSSVYSDYGKGIRIGFDFEGFLCDGVELFCVSYQGEMPTVNCNRNIPFQERMSVVDQLMKQALRTKSLHWSWQNESRLIIGCSSPLCNKRPCDSPEWRKKGVVETCSINLRKYVTEISFGAAVDCESISNFIPELEQLYPRAEIYVVKQDSRAYQYYYENARIDLHL